jgi:hypothetical protein
VIAQAPEEAAGVSLRARFTNFPMGSVWYDDFTIEEVDPGENLLPNGDLETMTPNFWEKMNGDAELIWADDSYATTWPNSRRSLKIVKSAAGDNAIGWKSVNNANLYWNHAGSDGADTYNLNFAAKTTGVNTSPANDDATIGVKYTFKSGGAILAEKLVGVDQSVADKDWSDYSDAVYVSGTPDEVWLELLMGKDATGTVWFDNIDCNTNAGWTMGVFGADCEIPYGWMNWSEPHGFANFVMDESAHSGSYSALLKEEDDQSDEMVFYSEPVPAEAGKWYKVSVWARTENISTDTTWMSTNVTPYFDDQRLGICFFFHKAPIETSWELTGGDQFAYIDQRTGKENEDWTRLMVLTYGPEEAAGFSVRARFNNFPMVSVWYDDFEVCELTLIPTSIEEYGKNGVSIVTEYMLRNNYPNPFNPLTHIEYSVPKAGMVELVVYNVMGQRVRTLMSGNHAQGTFSAMWDGTDNNGNVVPSGIYFYQLQGEGAVITKKMTFLK